MLKVTYLEDTRPIKSITVTQPKGTLDLTLTKNTAGSRVRMTNSHGETVNVAVSEVTSFIEALNKITKFGAKAEQARTAGRYGRAA